MITFSWLRNGEEGFAVQKSCSCITKKQLLLVPKGEEVCLADLRLCMTSNKVWFYVKGSGWAWPAMGSIFGLRGLTKKRTGSPEEPLQAISSSSSSSSSSSTPLGLCLYLACVFVCVSLTVCVCVCVCVSEFASAPCPCCLSPAAPLKAADPISWQYCGSPCCDLSKAAVWKIPEMPNRKHWWPGLTLCPARPPRLKMKCTRSIIVSSMQTPCMSYCPCTIYINIFKIYKTQRKFVSL